MAATEDRVPVGVTDKSLRTFRQTTVIDGVSRVVQVEAISVVDPEVVAAISKVTNAEPGATDYGQVVRQAGVVGVKGADGATIASTANPVSAQISDGTRTATVRDTGASDSLNVSIVDAAGNQITTFGGAASDAIGTGTITALNGRVSLAISGNAGASCTLTGTWSATITPQVSFDGGTTWAAVNFYTPPPNGAVAATVATNGQREILIPGGVSHVAVEATAFTSGTVSVALRGTASNTSGGFVQGPVANDSPVGGNPILIGGFATTGLPTAVTTGDVVRAWMGTRGQFVTTNQDNVTSADGASNVGSFVQLDTAASNLVTVGYRVGAFNFNGTTWDRPRSTGIGNNVVSTGIAAASPYGQFLGNATQPAITTGNYAVTQLDPAGNLRTAPQRPTATDILSGRQTFAATTGATTVITVSAGRTWVGTLGASVSCATAAASATEGKALATFTTAGAGVTPAAGTYFVCSASCGANAATGATGSQGNNYGSIPFTIVAPAGNSVTVQVATTQAGTTSLVEAFAIGIMQ